MLPKESSGLMRTCQRPSLRELMAVLAFITKQVRTVCSASTYGQLVTCLCTHFCRQHSPVQPMHVCSTIASSDGVVWRTAAQQLLAVLSRGYNAVACCMQRTVGPAA